MPVCAVIGAGGAPALLMGLRNVGAHMTLFARDELKGQALAIGLAPARGSAKSWAGFDVLINATPLGTLGDLKIDGSHSGSAARCRFGLRPGLQST